MEDFDSRERILRIFSLSDKNINIYRDSERDSTDTLIPGVPLNRSTHSLSHYQPYYIYYISYIFTSILYYYYYYYYREREGGREGGRERCYTYYEIG